MDIKILGSGCANCAKLEEVSREAVLKLGVDAEITKVTDVAEIMRYGVMTTPALVVDEELRLAGRVPSVDEVAAIISRVGA